MVKIKKTKKSSVSANVARGSSKSLQKKPSGKNLAKRPVLPSPKKKESSPSKGAGVAKNQEDGAVKRNTYSKAARAALLTSADARQKLISMGGENTINIIREFEKDMSDEDLSRKTGIKASEVRVVLNRLHNYGIFSYTRIRDRDSGWYSYIWKLSMEKLREQFGIVEGGVVGEETSIEDGENKYRCTACSPEKLVDFENAVDVKFKCGRCGSPLEFFEGKKK